MKLKFETKMNGDSNQQKQRTKFISAMASFMLLQMSAAPNAFAQDKTTGPGLNNSNPDNWPWMQVNPETVKPKVSPTASGEPTSAPAATPAQSPAGTGSSASASPFPDALTNPVGAASEHKETERKETKPSDVKLQGEKAKIEVESRTQEKRPEFKEERPAVQAQQPKSQSHMLFGRIEELSAGVGAKFPVLKAQTAKMDLSGTALKAGAVDNIYSGQAIRSFPATMNGTWGGSLQLQQINQDPLYYQLDADEAKQTAELMRAGIQGKVNFTFENTARGVNLEPAEIFFSAPMTQSRMASQISHLGSGGMTIPGMGNMAQMPGMENMMKSMMMSMPYVWKMSLGATQGTGLSGNALQTTLIKNEVRQLSPTVIEEQIISQEHDTNPKTGRTRNSYSESVVRFTRYDASRQYVQAAAVDYNSDKRFLRKMVFAGYVTKGVVEHTDPMGGLGGLGGGGAGGAGGMGGLGDLQKMLQGGGMPGMPTNQQFPPNLKGLFGQ